MQQLHDKETAKSDKTLFVTVNPLQVETLENWQGASSKFEGQKLLDKPVPTMRDSSDWQCGLRISLEEDMLNLRFFNTVIF